MRAKRFLKTSVIVAIVAGISAGAYMLYFYTIGVPKTQARTYYNLAIKDLQEGDKEKAKVDLQTALNSWQEPYIQQKLQELER
ncbi:MAG: hypothetical protein ACMG57_05490 [Candidatus Dojkabacteria bacterium]